MAAPDPLAGTVEAFGIQDWLEAVTSTKIGSDMVSRTGGEAILTAKIDGRKVRGCQRFCLGWDAVGPYLGTGTPSVIFRSNPVFHPRNTNLYCTSCSCNDFAPWSNGPLISPANAPLATTPPSTSSTLGRRALYKKSTVTLRFETVPYLFGDDPLPVSAITLLPSEWLRNTWIDTEPRTEVLSLTGFQLIYTEGTQGIAGGVGWSGPAGQAFPGSVGQLLVKPDIRLGWDLVPETFVMSAGTYIPTNILAGLGCVNATSFLGYPAGTLLCLGAKQTRKTNVLALSPLPGAPATESAYIYTYELLLKYFNPTKGVTGSDTPIQLIPKNFPGTQIGHTCFPWKGNVAPGAPGAAPGPFDLNAGKWFVATFDGNDPTKGGQTLFAQYEYANFFTSPN
jgi:hypothetical protein